MTAPTSNIIPPTDKTINKARNNAVPLDLLSISQTNSKNDIKSDTNTSFGQTYALPFLCHNNAPYFALKLSNKRYALWQGNCNDWTCPRCGILRAKHEYGRIVNGCRELDSTHDLFFLTLTCRGADLSVEDADKNYLKWTNKFLTSARTKARRAGDAWHYVQVTERQKRGHPHSHLIITWIPSDLSLGSRDHWQTVNGQKVKTQKECLRSEWIRKQCVRSGLGDQYDISKVRSAEGVSRYVAKYLFKDSMFSTQWAKNWRRVRYSQSFPKLPERKNGDAIPLLNDDDWQSLAKRCSVLKVHEDANFVWISRKLGKNDILIQMTEKVNLDERNQ